MAHDLATAKDDGRAASRKDMRRKKEKVSTSAEGVENDVVATDEESNM